MYKEYFGLEELPFSIAPDPRYLYMSEQHREALAHLVYGFNSEGGFVLLTGDVGTGKTTICRCLLEQMHENSVIAFIINPKLTVEELLAVVCDEFGIHCPKGNTSIKVFVDLINAFLLDVHAMGHKALLIIDEAQNLSADVLEQLRLLTNLETNQCKLLQIILLGQPELKDKLSKPELKQLAQRIIARYHLGPLSSDDVGAYVAHRLSVAGVRRELFPASTINALYLLSGGIPRLINVLCDRALLGAFVQGKNDVNKPTLVKAAKEVFGGGRCENQQKKLYKPILTALLFIVLAAWLASTYFKEPQSAQINKTEPVKLDTLHLPANVSGSLSKETAYQSLFRQWSISYQPSENITVCRQAQMRGLRCLNGIGSLDTLRDFNMPAVLKLFDNEGKEFYAALTSLKDRTAAFIVGNETKIVAVKDIESRWLGEYTLLWRAPTDYQGEIRPGSGGTVIQWLDRQLSQIQGRSSRPSENLVYDDELVRQIKKFQLSHGLIPDGIVGTQTLIHLDIAAGAGVPALIYRQADGS